MAPTGEARVTTATKRSVGGIGGDSISMYALKGQALVVELEDSPLLTVPDVDQP